MVLCSWTSFRHSRCTSEILAQTTGFCEENPPRLEVAFEGFGPQVGVELVGGGVGLKCLKYRISDILEAFLNKLMGGASIGP